MQQVLVFILTVKTVVLNGFCFCMIEADSSHQLCFGRNSNPQTFRAFFSSAFGCLCQQLWSDISLGDLL